MVIYSKIIGIGTYLPNNKITNNFLVKKLSKMGIYISSKWIFLRSGIYNRYYVENNVFSSDLALEASKIALNNANLKPNDINMIIFATSTPDFLNGSPSTACVLQYKLGITNNSPAMDIQAVCSGFTYSLSIADNFIKSGLYKNILVVGSEVLSKILDFNNKSTCILFGDGAGALLITSSKKIGIFSSKLCANGKYKDILCIPGYINNGSIIGSAFLYMNGKFVFKITISVLKNIINEILKKTNTNINEIDWIIPHQANIRIMIKILQKLKIPFKKMISIISEYGNTSSASIPLALNYAINNGFIKSGHNILIESAGGGLTWGAILLKI